MKDEYLMMKYGCRVLSYLERHLKTVVLRIQYVQFAIKQLPMEIFINVIVEGINI